MLKKRIIPCLDIKNGRTVKGVNFVGLRDAGDPVELAAQYAREGADELVFLDITATIENRATLIDLVKRVSKEIDIPFTVGGGVRTLADASELVNAGADKVSVNSAAVARPELLEEIASNLGSQCLTLAVDAKQREDMVEVVIHGGRTGTGIELFQWLDQAISNGVGEILLTSMGSDGTKQGFDIPILSEVSERINVPVIASGGAGTMEHFQELFTQTKVTAGLAASIFHFGEIPIPQLKNYLKEQQIPIR